MGKQAQPTRSVILCLHGFLSPSHTPLRCVHRVWARVPLSGQSKAHYDPSSHWSSASQRFLVDTCAQVMQPQTQGRPTEENFTNLNILQFKMTKIEQLSPEKKYQPSFCLNTNTITFLVFSFFKKSSQLREREREREKERESFSVQTHRAWKAHARMHRTTLELKLFYPCWSEVVELYVGWGKMTGLKNAPLANKDLYWNLT